MSLHVKAIGVLLHLLLPASALHISASSQVSSYLHGQFRDLLTAVNASEGEASGVLEAAGTEVGALIAANMNGTSTARTQSWDGASTRSSIMLGTLIAVAIALLIGSFLLLSRIPSYEYRQHPPENRQFPGQALEKALSTRSPRKPRSKAGSASDRESERAGLASSMGAPSAGGFECASETTITDTDVDEQARMPLSLVPLCPQLMVPDTSNLRVLVPDVAHCKRQDTILNITSVPALGVRPLFRARIAENGPSPGIYLETLDGEQHFAFVSTEEVWDNTAGATPKMAILRPDRLQFATMKKNQRGDYNVMCGLGTLASFSGDFLANEVQVVSGQGRMMAQAHQGTDGHFEVTTSPSIDAGLIIIGLLAIAKCEKMR